MFQSLFFFCLLACFLCRHCLWIVGNGLTLSNSGCVWKNVVLDAKNRGCYFNAVEDTQLAEAIVSAVTDSNSLLFNKAKWKVFFLFILVSNLFVHIILSLKLTNRNHYKYFLL